MIKNLLLMAITISQATVAHASNYDSNAVFRITELLTYPNDRIILFRSDNMPKISGCAVGYFVIPADSDADGRHQALSRLLTAFASKEVVNIGYDGTICGPSGYIIVYRVG